MPKKPPKPDPVILPHDVSAIRGKIQEFLNMPGEGGVKIGNCTFGVYAFFDYDGEPIYVGKTYATLRDRIGRHLTNQRTDAVAMNVLDPFEVAEVAVWPLFTLQGKTRKDQEAKKILAAGEYAVFRLVLQQSALQAVLNEKGIPKAGEIPLPQSYKQRIIPSNICDIRKHPDIRIARRASTIANLARVISERDVSTGLRKTLLTQAKRLKKLAEERYNEIGGELPVAAPDEEE
jgi:hypothetical protein